MHVEWYTDEVGFERLGLEWNALLHRSISDTLFLTLEWQTQWWRHLGTGSICIIAVREEDGALAGILPMFLDSQPDGGLTGTSHPVRTLSLIGCVDVSDYLDVIAAKGRESDVYRTLVETLARPDFPAWDRIQFCTLPASSPTNTEFRALAEARGLSTEWRLHDVSPLIELPASWDDYLATLDKKQRHEIRRKLRRLEESNARWYAVESGAGLDEAVANFIELHKKSQPEKHLFMDERMQQFFIEMARTCAAQGWLRLEFLEIEGKSAASIFSFVYRNEVLVYNSGYNPDQYGTLSPGVALFAHSIQQAITAGHRVYDFLRGDEEYKYRFGAKSTNVYELHIHK